MKPSSDKLGYPHFPMETPREPRPVLGEDLGQLLGQLLPNEAREVFFSWDLVFLWAGKWLDDLDVVFFSVLSFF